MNLADKELHIVGGGAKRYGALQITHRGRTQTLDKWIARERDLVREMNEISQLVEGHILEAHKQIDHFIPKIEIVEDKVVLDHFDDEQYRGTIDALSSLLLGDAKERHSPQAQKLMKIGIDYLIKSHRKFFRKNGSPYSVHPFMVASLVAAEGVDFPTIIAAMLHDRVEESIDSYTARQSDNGNKVKEEDKANRASGILYSTGLYFYEQVRNFVFPQRYFGDINSMIDIIDKMSRTDGQTYYEYLQKLFYPKPPERQPMKLEHLMGSIDFEVQRAIRSFNGHQEGCGDELVEAYLKDIDNYYITHCGRKDNEPNDDEKKRETYRIMIGKGWDRGHNTRDMDQDKYPDIFTVQKRLYGIGYKNAYFVQQLELKLSRQKIKGSEDMRICQRLLTDLRLATLTQLLHDEQTLRDKLDDETVKNIEGMVDMYKQTSGFQRVTSVGEGSPLDGLIHRYDAKAQGDSSILKVLDGDETLQFWHVLAFRSLFENFIAYAAGYGPKKSFSVSNFDIKLSGRQGNGFATTTLRRSVRR